MREFTVPPLAPAPSAGGLADIVFEHAAEAPDRVAFGRQSGGRWRDVTAEAFRDEVLAVAKGLLAQGVRDGDRVALMSRTRYEWTLFDFALWCVGAQSVPIYPASSAEQVYWTLHDAGATACVVEHEDHAMTVGSVIDRLPRLARLWQLDADAAGELGAAGAGVPDEEVHRRRSAVTPASPATVIYTPGTTGRPKACVLTHANLMAETDNIVHGFAPVFRPSGEDPALLLALPLAHVLGRMVQVAAVRGGIRLGHRTRRSQEALLSDLRAFRPTVVCTVPHLFERVFSAARREAEQAGKERPFEKAVEVAVRYAGALEDRSFGTGPGPGTALRVQRQVFDKLVYSKIRESLGGRLRFALSGGSSLDRRLGLFFAGAGITVVEGYGLTETAAAATANPADRPRFGTVGLPVPGTAVRIAPDGEVWLSGAQVFAGYLDDPRATEAVLRDGWLATGDLGALDDEGYLTVSGRKNEVLVTADGARVQPSALEDRVRAHPLVDRCLVVGNGRPYLAALVTLDRREVAHWLALRGRLPLPAAELVRDTELEAEIREAVVTANAGLSPAESVRTFRILTGRFTEEQGLLTPTLKLKRRAVEKAYATEVDALYQRTAH
ncbi:long-chain fatty acid--CoA ligase [Streptomyces sp. AV19]|uniref:AMP-dependent synthetase/ligase n=1 Tax=Streptomyces sp. AV19 TaxID=2793068 RepID=UPI0018FEF777|nr:AMP-dependent synthetase/ligase [Streptomyces sp. AV19]MBH1938238.1 long-chain fatty acid--CoA ligase [Streptomyces sp. AV19]MDG4534868.1 AMP-dependent synthetase/ligase [Streptomyces sp. AV19]